MRQLQLFFFALLAPAALAACHTLASAPDVATHATYTLTLRPPESFVRRSLASSSDVRTGAYTQGDIDHLDVELDSVASGGAETSLMLQALQPRQLGNNITFDNLASGQAYRIYARAYHATASVAANLISTSDSRSYVDIGPTNNDTPFSAAAISTLKVSLLARPALVISPLVAVPFGAVAMVCDSMGNLYVARADQPEIDKITPAGIPTVVAGGNSPGITDGIAQNNQFQTIGGLALDGDTTLYVSDAGSHTLRKITLGGGAVVSTIAGIVGSSNSVNGTGTGPQVAQFGQPNGIAIDNAHKLFVADSFAKQIRQVDLLDPNFTVSSVAGVFGTSGFFDGPALTAMFLQPNALAYSPKFTLGIGDAGAGLRALDSVKTVTVIHSGASMDGTDSTALVSAVSALAYDALGNLYIADSGNIRRRDILGKVTTLQPRKSANGTNQPVPGAACLAVAPDGTLYTSVPGNPSIYVIK
jgi:hypothetical protein